MKILIVGYRKLSSNARALRTGEFLMRYNHQVHFLGTKENIKNKKLFPAGVKLHQFCTAKYFGNNAIIYLFHYLFLFIESIILNSFLFIRYRFDVIIVYGIPDFLVLTFPIPKFFGTKIILELLDVMPEAFATKFKLSFNHPIEYIIKRIELLSLKFSNHIVVVTHPYTDIINARGIKREKISVIMNLPEIKNFNHIFKKQNKPDFNLFFHGTIAERLDLESLVRATQIVNNKHPEIRLTIIGEGEDSKRIIDLISALKLNNCINFINRIIPFNELFLYFNDVDLGIVTYKNSIATNNILPTKLLEYISLNIPCVVAELSTVKYYFTEEMVKYYIPEDVNSLSQSILTVFENPEYRKTITKNALSFFNYHCWNEQQSEYLKILDLCKKKSKHIAN